MTPTDAYVTFPQDSQDEDYVVDEGEESESETDGDESMDVLDDGSDSDLEEPPLKRLKTAGSQTAEQILECM